MFPRSKLCTPWKRCKTYLVATVMSLEAAVGQLGWLRKMVMKRGLAPTT